MSLRQLQEEVSVDDLLTGANSIQEARTIRDQRYSWKVDSYFENRLLIMKIYHKIFELKNGQFNFGVRSEWHYQNLRYQVESSPGRLLIID